MHYSLTIAHNLVSLGVRTPISSLRLLKFSFVWVLVRAFVLDYKYTSFIPFLYYTLYSTNHNLLNIRYIFLINKKPLLKMNGKQTYT